MNRINHISGWNRASAALGSVVWLSFGALSAFGVLPLELIEHLFLLAPLVIVPLGLGLLNSPDRSSRWLAAGSFLQPFAAILTLTSFFVPEGKLAAVMASGWLVATVLLGLSGLGFPRKLFRNTTEACFDAALLYLPVGAIWLVLSRLGATPMHLAEPIVLLTAVHFHFSGFGLAVIAGATGRALRADSTASKIFRFVAIGLVGGTFLIAIGFLTSPLVKVAAIALFAGNLSLFSMFLLANLSAIRGRLARLLLGVAASSLAVGMALALLYGVGEYMGELLVSIPRMAKLHGPLNSIGFTLCALVGWALEEQRRASRPGPRSARMARRQAALAESELHGSPNVIHAEPSAAKRRRNVALGGAKRNPGQKPLQEPAPNGRRKPTHDTGVSRTSNERVTYLSEEPQKTT